MAAKNYWEENKVSGTELMAMRMMRGKSIQDMARMHRRYKEKIMEYPAYEIEWIEKNCYDEAPYDLVEFYMTKLGITRSHMAQFKKILKGQLKTFTEDRAIPKSLKEQVKSKCKNRCTNCGSNKNLHIHHIERFSKGGQNNIENLTLLCASCHAEEHKNEPSYYMLKKKAEG